MSDNVNALTPLFDAVLNIYELADPALISRALATTVRDELRRAEERIADRLPPLTPADFLRLANGDHAVRAEVERFRDARWSLVDVTALAEAEEGEETWTILRGSSRFEVREVPRYEARRVGGAGELEGWVVWDNEVNEQVSEFPDDVLRALQVDPESNGLAQLGAERVAAYMLNETSDAGRAVWIVWDTDNDQDARECDRDEFDFRGLDVTDETSAEECAEQANVEDYRTNAHGWPFAHNYAAAIEDDERDADDFDAAGFVVARHEPSGQVYAGIDGGGYSFTDAHWAPLYLRVLLHGRYAPPHIYVPTDAGLRRVVRGDA